MDFNKVKDDYIGKGVKRLKYEAKVASMKEMDIYELGIAFGLNQDETFMLYEVVLKKQEDAVKIFKENMMGKLCYWN